MGIPDYLATVIKYLLEEVGKMLLSEAKIKEKT